MSAMAGQFDKLSDLEIVALTIWGEARGEPLLSQIAVACVIRNRANIRHLTFREVCLQPKQFSCFSKAGGATNYLMVMEQAVTRQMSPAWNQCLWIASGVVQGYCQDVTGGADHYLTTDLLNSPQKPSWATKMTFCGEFGNHTMLRA